MATTAAKAFDEFKALLKLTETQEATVMARRDSAASYAKQAFPADCDMPVLRTKLIGSAGRSTIIRPLDDIDLMVVFRNKDDIFEERYS